MKECTRCHQVKDESEFSPNGKYLRSDCKACATAERVEKRHARGLKPSGRPAQPEPMEKVCTACGVLKPASAFYRHPQSKSGRLQARCKDCINGYNRQWAQEHPRRAREINRAAVRRHHVRRQYGLTPEEYAALVEAAGGHCQVCGASERVRRGKDGELWELCVDHDHVTGQVRGLLCHDCNSAIARVRDDPARLRQLADYLERFREQRGRSDDTADGSG